MKKRLVAILLILIGILMIILYAGIWRFGRPIVNNNYRFPGEFEKQQALWLQWPSEIYNANDHPLYPVILEVIKAFTPYIRINLLTRNEPEIEEIKRLFQKSGISGSEVHFYIVDHLSIWTRDVGPIFIKDRLNRLRIVDFGFNNYSRGGSPEYINIEGQEDQTIAGLLKLPVIQTSLISEGGAIESNGQGTLMVTASVVLKRNPGLTKEQIEHEYQRVLGVQKVIWLKKGLAEDDAITGGHINEIARFAAPNTILLAQIPADDRGASPDARESYQRLEENYRILRSSTDQNGRPFRLIRIPMPPTLYQEANLTGETMVRSYLNYALSNGVCVMPVYWKPGRDEILKKTDEQVQALFKKVFPGRKIIGIDAENVNRWGGGVHCITQHMPVND